MRQGGEEGGGSTSVARRPELGGGVREAPLAVKGAKGGKKRPPLFTSWSSVRKISLSAALDAIAVGSGLRTWEPPPPPPPCCYSCCHRRWGGGSGPRGGGRSLSRLRRREEEAEAAGGASTPSSHIHMEGRGLRVRTDGRRARSLPRLAFFPPTSRLSRLPPASSALAPPLSPPLLVAPFGCHPVAKARGALRLSGHVTGCVLPGAVFPEEAPGSGREGQARLTGDGRRGGRERRVTPTDAQPGLLPSLGGGWSSQIHLCQPR